jgi:hypothetical protein
VGFSAVNGKILVGLVTAWAVPATNRLAIKNDIARRVALLLVFISALHKELGSDGFFNVDGLKIDPDLGHFSPFIRAQGVRFHPAQGLANRDKARNAG